MTLAFKWISQANDSLDHCWVCDRGRQVDPKKKISILTRGIWKRKKKKKEKKKRESAVIRSFDVDLSFVRLWHRKKASFERLNNSPHSWSRWSLSVSRSQTIHVDKPIIDDVQLFGLMVIFTFWWTQWSESTRRSKTLPHSKFVHNALKKKKKKEP